MGDDERLAEGLRPSRADQARGTRRRREERKGAREARIRRALRPLAATAVALVVPAAVWAERSDAVPFLGAAGTGRAALLLWTGLATILITSGVVRLLAGLLIVPMAWLMATAILVGDLRSPRTVILSVAHVDGLVVVDRAGRYYAVPRTVLDRLRVGGTYRCTGQAQPVLGLHLQRCLPLRQPAR